ncbi:hypothetical protein [Capnocytophaga sputigena]|jgi:hypothetical protein|uniref:hypothetical protein n=1 Tax=Capnocytophaga sputigena TaxID=1019 RepID=UPI0028D42410|nr:hypothetical protein [Capnocytophaga sputigena]
MNNRESKDIKKVNQLNSLGGEVCFRHILLLISTNSVCFRFSIFIGLGFSLIILGHIFGPDKLFIILIILLIIAKY